MIDVGDRVTVDLEDRVDELEEELQAVEDEADEVHEEYEEGEVSHSEWVELLEDYEQLDHAVDLLKRDIERFEGSEFTIKKLAAGDISRINDLVRHDAIEDGQQDTRGKLDAYEMRTVEVGVTETPPEAPNNATAFSAPTKQFLYEKVDNLNRFGEVDVGNFKLAEKIESDD